MLCENTFNGGGGYTPEQVGSMTPDQIFMRLCDKTMLREKGTRVSRKMPVIRDGFVNVRTSDGTVKKMKPTGESLYQRLVREEREKNGT